MAERDGQPEERGGQKRTRKFGIILMTLLVLGVVGLALKANVWKFELPISGVRVEGNAIVGTPEILRLAAIPKGEKLFTLDLGAVRERIRKNPYLRQVSVNRQGPDVGTQYRSAIFFHSPEQQRAAVVDVTQNSVGPVAGRADRVDVILAVGVERTFPIHSPKIVGVETVTRGKVRRSKLYYLRDKVGKEARVKERRY